MKYEFLNKDIDIDNIKLPASEKINPYLLKNSYAELIKAVDFLSKDEKLLYIHGFLGTGKRQFINYLMDFVNNDVIKLEYYCKESTVCDDILLNFINIIESNSMSKIVNFNTKVTTLNVKMSQYISSINQSFIIILHSFDDILEENKKLVSSYFGELLNQNNNLKLLFSTRAMLQSPFSAKDVDRKIFLKGFSKDIFKEFIEANGIKCTDTTLNDFYKYTRGYYYYTALACKIVQAMKISLNEFLEKYTKSGISWDAYLGKTYVNLIPTTIRNFFWFLCLIRHGISYNALAVFELYDDFSIEYLKTNLMIFVVNEVIYVQDYFLQNIDISMPAKIEIKLHKYIISIYEKQLKEPIQSREILISRQALRAEIEFHNARIYELENKKVESVVEEEKKEEVSLKNSSEKIHNTGDDNNNLISLLEKAKKLQEDKKYTESIEEYLKILDIDGIDLRTVVEVRLDLARLYKEIEEYSKAQYYYELVEVYYKQNNEVINLNYLYYELTSLYFLMYKFERAVDTIKKVIYSVDTPQSLMVQACTLLGNIYSAKKMPDEAYSYYEKALASLDDNTQEDTLAELYFKYALANDDKGDYVKALEYYVKCISINLNNPYKALAYSNMGSYYFDNENYADAWDCFLKAYEIEKNNNNYDGIYYTSSYLAKIAIEKKDKNALNYLIEAQQCAEFINEDFYLVESSLALGDYYYDNVSMNKKALKEYLKARKYAVNLGNTIDINKIEQRIKDMKLRMNSSDFEEVEKKYE